MQGMLLVGLGGFLGAIARYKLGGLVLHLTAQERFPLFALLSISGVALYPGVALALLAVTETLRVILIHR